MKPQAATLLFVLALILTGSPSAHSEDESRELTVTVNVTGNTRGIVVNFDNVPPTVTLGEFPRAEVHPNQSDSGTLPSLRQSGARAEVHRALPSVLDPDFLEVRNKEAPSQIVTKS